MDLPSLIPTDTREYERFLSGIVPDKEEGAFDDMMVYFWTSVCAFIIALACAIKKDAAAATWFGDQWTSDCPRLDKLRSIGQHYGMDTGLLDATSSIAVALWFATHDFKTGAYRSRESGVVYRIAPAQLEKAQQWLEDLPEHEGAFEARMIDLGDTPASIAPRAVRQQGWSLVGWEHPRLVIKMATSGGLNRYVFPTGPAPCSVNSLTREWLVPHPQQDPVRTLFEMFWICQPRSLREAQQWIDRYWNIGNESRIQIDKSGSWFDRLGSEFGRILDHYSHDLRERFVSVPH
ncbi:MAG TPA: FRG domain-containing protein [Chthoniobacterales bacterium]|nr:FRG domain-containing protein [Chthoniobacterales bacterium]